MNTSSHLPQPVRKAQKSLEPYIKQRNEAALIRRILASHLTSHLNHGDGSSLPRPLSLLDTSSDVVTLEHGIKGLQKEYLRCARANIKAKKEFAGISREHRQAHEDGTAGETPRIQSQDGHLSYTDSYLEVARQRQKHERLRIVQDYIDVLVQKPAAATEHLDPKLVLKDVESLPKVPSEVLNAPKTSQSLGGADLATLVDRLEKSVFRAKMLLRTEQKLLEKVKSQNHVPSSSVGSQLQALGSTRNELISWIEIELARAGDNSSVIDDRETLSEDGRGKDHIEAQLASIHRQYSRYTKARQRLILAATGRLQIPPTSSPDEAAIATSTRETYNSNRAQIIFPYLDQMVAISNDQKALIQYKSHLTTSLAKQLKETNQGLDRLAEESHLLLSHPLTTASSQNKRTEIPVSFGEEMSHHEKPDSSRRAQAWVYAAESAGKATQEAVSSTLEEGGSIVEHAHQTLKDVQRLLGNGVEMEAESSGDIWTVLDGTLGVIKGDGAN